MTNTYSAQKSEHQGVTIHVWPKDGAWAGMVHLMPQNQLIKFVAETEESAKAEGQRIAGQLSVVWQPLKLILDD